ncbi:MAG: hypothetical protein NVSMB3_03600 [Acidobacteriaceae bacterium]
MLHRLLDRALLLFAHPPLPLFRPLLLHLLDLRSPLLRLNPLFLLDLCPLLLLLDRPLLLHLLALRPPLLRLNPLFLLDLRSLLLLLDRPLLLHLLALRSPLLRLRPPLLSPAPGGRIPIARPLPWSPLLLPLLLTLPITPAEDPGRALLCPGAARLCLLRRPRGPPALLAPHLPRSHRSTAPASFQPALLCLR